MIENVKWIHETGHFKYRAISKEWNERCVTQTLMYNIKEN